jgi:hypothetical protein
MDIFVNPKRIETINVSQVETKLPIMIEHDNFPQKFLSETLNSSSNKNPIQSDTTKNKKLITFS